MKKLYEKELLTLNMVGWTLRSERGMTLIVVLMLMVIILAITGAGLLFSGIDLRVSGNYRVGTQAFYAADTGASWGFAQIALNPPTPAAFGPTTLSGGVSYSGTIGNIGTIPATGCSLGIGTQLNSGTCYLLEYQIDATGVGPLSATRQVQALATFGPLN